MKKIILPLMLLLGPLAQAQTVASFESITLSADSFKDGRDGLDLIVEEGLQFPVSWDTSYQFWSGGWAISNQSDSSRMDFDGLYQSITGSGHESQQYLVGQQGSFFVINQADLMPLQGFYLTNTSYAYHSMRNGDFVAKKFGGQDGTDPDYFVLYITGKANGTWLEDTIEFYLADFRFEDSNQDYIVKDWSWISIEKLKGADSLFFHMASSDTGDWGINTPTFFVVDHFIRQWPTSVKDNELSHLKAWPNPAQDWLQLSIEISYEIFDNQGRKVAEGNGNSIHLAALNPGIYFLRAEDGSSTRFIKQ